MWRINKTISIITLSEQKAELINPAHEAITNRKTMKELLELDLQNS